MKLLLLIVAGFLLSSVSFAVPKDESGPGNGTDYVKVLFAQAQLEIVKELAPLDDGNIGDLAGLAPEVLTWLQASAEPSSGVGSHLTGVKSYVQHMDLRFQQGTCSDESLKPASICFFRDPMGIPYVMISIQDNQLTTEDQAMAMLIHEAGHFTGETDHLLLDQVGLQLVNALKQPGVITAQAQVTSEVSNVFTAQDDCNAGTSDQAEQAKNAAIADLTVQCANQTLSCDPDQALFVYSGQAEFLPNVGYDMKVTCSVRAVLKLTH